MNFFVLSCKVCPHGIIIIMKSQHRPTQVHTDTGFVCKVKFNNFPDGDSHCVIENPEHIVGADILIFHQLYPQQNEWIVRLLLLLQTLEKLCVRSITLFAPYMPYSRQDKAYLPGESVSSRALCKVLASSGCSSLYTIDCHLLKGKDIATIEGLTINNILAGDKLIKAAREHSQPKSLIIGPDEGSSYLVNSNTMTKSRNEYSEKNGIIERSINKVYGEIKVSNFSSALIVDDMIVSGSTILSAIDLLSQQGVKSFCVATIHGLFLDDSLNTVSKVCDKVVYTDTIPREGSVPVVDWAFEETKRKIFKLK